MGNVKRLSVRKVLAMGTLALGLLAAACSPAAAPAPTSAPAKPTEAPKPAATAAAPAKPAEPSPKPAAAPATAAASPVTKPAAAPAAVDYKAEMDRLYQEAKKEGKLVLYSSMNLDDARVVLPEFEKAFPGVKAEHVRATGETLQQRLITETRGGKVLGDVLDTNAGQYYPVMQQGLMEAYPIPAAADMPAQFRDEKGLWTTGRVTTVVVAWNKDLVKAGEEPKTFDDLADPKWKGKIIMEAGDQEMFMTLLKQKYPTEERGLEVFRGIGANQPEAHQGHSQQADLLAAGQGAVCMGCYGHHIVTLKSKGAPVEFATTEGVLNSIIIGLIKGGPNPNAGKLYLNWTMSPEGQRVLGAAGRAPARPGTPISTPLMPDGMKWYASRPEYTAEFAKYDTLWQQIFNLRS